MDQPQDKEIQIMDDVEYSNENCDDVEPNDTDPNPLPDTLDF